MAEGLALALITDAARALVHHLLEVRACVKHNDASVKEIEEFVEQLNKNVSRVRDLLPLSVSGDAIDSLVEKLKGASEFVKSHERRGYFKSVWSAKEIKEQIGLLQKDLDSAFQMALLLTNLEVALDAGKKNKDFQHEMLRIYECHASDTAQAKEDLQRTLGLLVLQIQPMHRKLQSVVAMVENLNQTTETQKFFADVLASISSASIPGERLPSSNIPEVFCDPITYEAMFDPVKATDGYTYNRWTIVDQNLSESPFNRKKTFSIVCDDLSLRRHLFEKVPTAESQFRERRQSYRAKALKLVDEGYDADALVMLENVLSWDEDDEQCLVARQVLSERRMQLSGLIPFTGTTSTSCEITDEEGEAAEFVRALDYVEKLVQGRVQESISGTGMAIQTLCKDFKDIKALGAKPGALHRLVDLITRESLRVSVTILDSLITSFAKITKAEENLLKFASFPGSFETLLSSLADNKSPRLQFWATRTVADLIAAEDASIRTGLTGSSDVIRSLVGLISTEVEETIQCEALRALENMLIKEVPVDLQLYPSISTRLVDSLVRERTDRFLAKALLLLNNLIVQSEHNKTAIRSAPKVVENLIYLVANSSFVITQRALRTLAVSVMECHDLVGKLSEKLSFEERMDGIRKFGLGYGVVIETLVNDPATITKLLDILKDKDHAEVHGEAVVVLIVLTATRDGAVCLSACKSSAIDVLVSLFSGKFGMAGAVVLGNLSHHIQIDLSSAANSSVLKCACGDDVYWVLKRAGCDDRVHGFYCYFVYNLAKRNRNRKPLRGTSVVSTLDYLKYRKGHDFPLEVRDMAERAHKLLYD